jgi:hypothetical protein
MPLEGYREALDVARRTGIADIVTNSQFTAGFDFYSRGLRMHYPPLEVLPPLLCDSEGPFVYIDYPLRGPVVDLACLRKRGIVPTMIPQRAGGKPGQMSVWVVADDVRRLGRTLYPVTHRHS